MAEIRKKEERKSFAEEASSLWLITFAGSIWAIHFAVCYAATAVVCQKFPDAVESLRLGIGLATAIALVAILLIAWRSWKQWDFLDDYDYVHDLAVEEDRHEFLGHASFLLSIISFIGVCYVAMPAFFLTSCG